MTQFDKPALSIADHIQKLKDRSLIITDEVSASFCLSNISYFRLSAYTRPFYEPDRVDHLFKRGTRFEDVLSLYTFDRELRLLLLDAIERIEVSLRAQMTNTLGRRYGPHGYLDSKLFDTRYDYSWLLEKLADDSKRREAETFLKHYRNKYIQAPEQPPIWMAVELLTFKEVSTLFSNLKNPIDTQQIESHFQFKYTLLKSWFRSLSDLRNLCAHHARVWNREFGSCPELPKRPPKKWPSLPLSIPVESRTNTQFINPQRRLYLLIIVIESMLRIINPENCWASRLINLLDRYPSVSRPHMGFPENWDLDPFWENAMTNSGRISGKNRNIEDDSELQLFFNQDN